MKSLFQLLDDSRLFYETGFLLSVLYMPEYLPLTGSLDEVAIGAISLLLKHTVLSAPSASSRLVQTHFERYSFIMTQLTSSSYVNWPFLVVSHLLTSLGSSLLCQREFRLLLGDQMLRCFLQEGQEVRVKHLIQFCYQLKNTPDGLKRLLTLCDEKMEEGGLHWTSQ